ncbi:DUF3299 domain-containing protein [Pseudaestuariivita sp.]|uniref:DUF3299 domain-containing protein n=1 Tax=Pseudaestuariivita sp. TaxID=2211669 RepID=UPI004059FBDD
MLTLAAAGALTPAAGRAKAPWEIGWDDLIPPGVPYGEIIGEGEMDVVADTWKPIFDANGSKLNERLDGALIRMPGFIIPVELTEEGTKEFILVPYLGACIHVPPPPPNQLVYVESDVIWPSDNLWDAVWVIGTMYTEGVSTDLAEMGYTMQAHQLDIYDWMNE